MRNFLTGRRLRSFLSSRELEILRDSYNNLHTDWEPLREESATSIFLLGKLSAMRKPVFTFKKEEDYIHALSNGCTEEFDIVRVVVDNSDVPVYSLEEYDKLSFDYAYPAKHAFTNPNSELI